MPLLKCGDARITQASSRRHWGDMSVRGNVRGEARENRRIFLEACGLSCQDLVCAKQSHGSRIGYVSDCERGRGAFSYDDALEDTDALVTDCRGLALAIFTADCLPVFLFDPHLPAVGIVHAGWRGSRDGITASAVRFMQDRFQSRPGELYAAFGPAIRSCCYCVGEEFEHYFSSELVTRDSRHYLDLAAVNMRQLLESGVCGKRIFDAGICTVCNSHEFFSHRASGGESGRMMSVICLRA
jgi:polyphenol oxidase